jgi:hypothetical protein
MGVIEEIQTAYELKQIDTPTKKRLALEYFSKHDSSAPNQSNITQLDVERISNSGNLFAGTTNQVRQLQMAELHSKQANKAHSNLPYRLLVSYHRDLGKAKISNYPAIVNEVND